MRLENMKAGRKGNLNVATEVDDNQVVLVLICWNYYIFCTIFTYSYILIRYFKWHLHFIWLKCGKRKGTLWSFIRSVIIFCFSFVYNISIFPASFLFSEGWSRNFNHHPISHGEWKCHLAQRQMPFFISPTFKATITYYSVSIWWLLSHEGGETEICPN